MMYSIGWQTIELIKSSQVPETMLRVMNKVIESMKDTCNSKYGTYVVFDLI